MANEDPSKTEAATPRRKEKAREEGNIPKSAELNKVAVLLVAYVALIASISLLGSELREIYIGTFLQIKNFILTEDTVYTGLYNISYSLAKMCLPLLLVMMTSAYIAGRIQVGSMWKIPEVKLGKLFDIGKGIKSLMFDKQTLVRLGKQFFQAVAIGFAPYYVLKKEYPNFAPLFHQNAEGLAIYILSVASTLTMYTMIPMIIIAAFDVWYQHYEYSEGMKMSKQEVKDEHKDMEGDPQVKSKRHEKMMAIMRSRMLSDVPKADVIITNPTHFAVALRYDLTVAPAPILVAKGVDHLAKKIREIAAQNRVPIRENRPLAQALYKQVQVGQVIPEEMYQAVAGILASLARFKQGRPQ